MAKRMDNKSPKIQLPRSKIPIMFILKYTVSSQDRIRTCSNHTAELVYSAFSNFAT